MLCPVIFIYENPNSNLYACSILNLYACYYLKTAIINIKTTLIDWKDSKPNSTANISIKRDLSISWSKHYILSYNDVFITFFIGRVVHSWILYALLSSINNTKCNNIYKITISNEYLNQNDRIFTTSSSF